MEKQRLVENNIAGSTGELETLLGEQSYIGGPILTLSDLQTLALLSHQPDPSDLPNTTRWFKHVSSIINESHIKVINKISLPIYLMVIFLNFN